MRNKAGLFLTPVVFAITPAVMAQSNGSSWQSPISVRAGGTYLTDGTARRGLGNFGWLAGVGVDLPFHGLFSPKMGEASIDLDYQGWSAHGVTAETLSLQYVERVPFSPMDTSGAQPYWGLGVGGYYDHASGASGSSVATMGVPGALSTGSSGGRARFSKTQIGGEILLGVRFQKNISLEAAYHLQPDIDGVSPNTLTLTVGYHF